MSVFTVACCTIGIVITAASTFTERLLSASRPTRSPYDSSTATAFCAPEHHAGEVPLFGLVRRAASAAGLDSADVIVQWMNLTPGRSGITRSLDSRSVRTDRDGRYIICALPAGATVVTRAERGSATTGAVFLWITQAPARLDLALDSTSGSATPAVDLERNPGGVRLALPAGNARYRAVVQNSGGLPVPGARARILGHRFAASDDRGLVTLDSLPGGSQTMEVIALGYMSERRAVEVSVGAAPPDTVVLISLRSVLDTIHVTAGRDITGFEARRREKVGQFITAADVERENPPNTTYMLKSRDGLLYNFDRAGIPSIVVNTGSKKCAPLVLVDGLPAPPAPRLPGTAGLNWTIHPDEIGGVEIYNQPTQIPPVFAKFYTMSPPPSWCGAIAFWTRVKLGLPKAIPAEPAAAKKP